jgi:hypothetical protein
MVSDPFEYDHAESAEVGEFMKRFANDLKAGE